MANAESPDLSTDLHPVTNKEDEVDPVAPAPEPKLPSRKDASLKEFLSKMDDYAPIVWDQITLSQAYTDPGHRFLMRLQTIILPKLAYLLHRKLMHD